MPSARLDPELLAEHVLRAVEQIPRGRVAAYGDLARIVGIGPRQVGAILAGSDGSDVPWWRVTNAAGDLPAHLRRTAAEQWAAESIPWKPNGLGCRMTTHRADLATLAAAYEKAVRDLPPLRP